MKTIADKNDDRAERCDENKQIAESFEQFGIHRDTFPPYKNAQEFAGRFRRCDRQEYAPTRYAVTTSSGD
jgi:hypothetical protein